MPHLSPIIWFSLFVLSWFYLLMVLLFVEYSYFRLGR